MLFLFNASTNIDVGSFIDYLSRASIIVFLIVVIYGGYKRWWVFGWVYKDLEKRCTQINGEKDAWRETALESAKVATKAFREYERRT
jgi:hypothetical protein